MPTAGFSGNAGYAMGVDIGRSGSNVTISNLHVAKSAGYTGQWTANSYAWSVSVSNGHGTSGTWSYDFRGNTSARIVRTIFANALSYPVALGSTVTVTVTVHMSFGSATVSQQVAMPNVPAAPSNIGVDQPTTNSLRYRFSGGSDGGSPITEWQVRYALASNFSGAVLVASSGTTVATGLNPGATYYFQSRGRNAMGWGNWSSVASGQTLPATPPSLTVTPHPSGASAALQLEPPSGVSGVAEYEVERTPAGGAPVGISTTSTTPTINGLLSGIGYTWRARARIGTYWSPWSAPQTIVQPNPSTSPGEFYDGSTPARADVSFSWAGTPGLSQSIATARGVRGWGIRAFSGSTAVLYQVAGGPSNYFARMLFITGTDASGAAVEVGNGGPNRSPVTAGITYGASVLVRPSRTQRLRVAISFYNAAGSQIVRAESVPVIVPGMEWQTLSVMAEAPEGSVAAAVRIQDTSAEGSQGWSLWKSGEWLDMVRALLVVGTPLTYFDGSMADTPEYKYAWLGAEDNSVSERRTLAVPELDLLADPDCEPMPTPPAAPAIPTNCVEDVVEWRTIRFAIPESEVARWGATVPTFILKAGDRPERQVRLRIYPNPDGVAPELVDPNSWEGELILTYIPANTEVRLDGVSREVWATLPGMQGGVRPADHLLFGTGGAPAVWPELTGGIGYVVTVDIPVDNPQYNLTVRALLTQRT